jgi:hypothetical protein
VIFTIGFILSLMGPFLLLDKSAFQCLSRPAVHAVFRYYRVVVPPVLVSEIQADYAKAKGGPKQFSFLIKKFENRCFEAHVDHRRLMRANLLGTHISMDRAPIVPGKQLEVGGNTIAVFPKSERSQMIERWLKGVLSAGEVKESQDWRTGTKMIDLERVRNSFKDLPLPRLTTPYAALQFVDACLINGKQDRLLRTVAADSKLSEAETANVFGRWSSAGKPKIADFAPYATYCSRVASVFSIGLLNDIVTTRGTNYVDLQYLYYLPFCQVFSSGDKLHADLAPLFLKPDQMAINNEDLKRDLEQHQWFWMQLSQRQRWIWMQRFGWWPSTTPHSFTFKSWQRFALPKKQSGNALAKIPPHVRERVLREFNAAMNSVKDSDPEMLIQNMQIPGTSISGIAMDLRARSLHSC